MKKNSTKIIDNAVKELREQKNLTQSQFAEKLDSQGDESFSITPDAISKIECGKINLSPDVALRICAVFNVSLDWLYKRTDEPLDAPSIILENLKGIFNLVPEEMTIDFHDDCLRFDYFSLTIMNALDKYLRSIANAEYLLQEQKIPEIGYVHWIKGAREEFNTSFNNAEQLEFSKYVVLPVSNLSEEMIRVLSEDKYQERRKTTKNGADTPK